jgi:hypothetical protein
MQCTTGSSEKDSCRLAGVDDLEFFFNMLRDELELTYAYVGCCIVEYPLWFSRVFRAVGLRGEGGTGDFMGVIGDFNDNEGRVAWEVEVVEMLKDNFGLATREASMLAVVVLVC